MSEDNHPLSESGEQLDGSSRDDGAGNSAAQVARRQMRRSRRRRPTVKPVINLKPADAIALKLSTQQEPHRFDATLRISNPSEHRIMFKIRTTSHDRFKVKPCFGLIDAACVVDVQIAVLGTQASMLYKSLAAGEKPVEKFRVQSTKMDPATLAQLSSAEAKEQHVIVTKVWKQATADGQVASNTLLVDMPTIAPPPDAHVEPIGAATQEAGTGPGVQPSKRTNGTTGSNAARESGGNATAGAGIGAGAGPQQTQPGMVPGGDTNTPLTPEDLERLRAHYNDLLRFTWNESAQHDQELTQRALELDAANKRLEEAQQRIRELEAANANVRRRRGAGGAAATSGEGKQAGDKDGDSGGSPTSQTVKIVRTGLPVWQVVIIAIVVFLLGVFWASP